MPLGDRLRAGPLLLVVLALLATLFTWSSSRGQLEVDLHERAFVRTDQQISSHSVGLAAVSSRLPNEEAWREFIAAQSGRIAVFIVPRSGTPANLIGSVPLIPGDGVGNTVTLFALAARLGLALTEVTPESVGQAVRQYVLDHAETFAVDGSQMDPAHAVRVHEQHWEVSIRQQANGGGAGTPGSPPASFTVTWSLWGPAGGATRL